MTVYAYDIYSGYIEDTTNVIGSHDATLVERFQRLGEFSQQSLGLPQNCMEGWQDAIQTLIMAPPERLTTAEQAVAMLMIMRDAGQRRFRIFSDLRQNDIFDPAFSWLNHKEFARDFIHSEISRYSTPDKRFDWGFLDINQIEMLLFEAMGNDSFKTTKTAVIAGRLAQMPRDEAVHALIDVGIETQNSISQNIDYLIVGSKGTGGTKYDKVKNLRGNGRHITVLDESGFEALLKSPKRPPANAPILDQQHFDDLVRSLRHVWAFDLDLYCISYPYDEYENTI